MITEYYKDFIIKKDYNDFIEECVYCVFRMTPFGKLLEFWSTEYNECKKWIDEQGE